MKTSIANAFHHARSQNAQQRPPGPLQFIQAVLMVLGVIGLAAIMLVLSLISLPLRWLNRIFRR